MEKTEMMKKFEKETNTTIIFDCEWVSYLEWLESKADAYDRLMSGGTTSLTIPDGWEANKGEAPDA